MNKTVIELVISDVDGTILNSKHEITTELIDCVKQAKQCGVAFVLASARSPQGMRPIADALGIPQNPIACYNGALIVSENKSGEMKTLFSRTLPTEEAKIAVDVVKEQFPTISISLYSGTDWYVDHFDKWAKIESGITGIKPIVKNLSLLLLIQEEIAVHKLLLIGESKEVVELSSYLKKLNLSNCSFYRSKDNYLEITHSEVSKESALKELANFFDLSLNKVMAIGDNYNDVPMLKLAGIGVAMGNSPLEVKENSRYITATNDQNGVAKALEDLIVTAKK